MNFKHILILSIFASSTGFSAPYETSLELDAYCRYINESGSRQAWKYYSPDFVTSYAAGGNIAGGNSDIPFTTGYRRFRIGLEYDFLNLGKGSLAKNLSEASCEYRRSLSAIEANRRWESAETEAHLLSAQLVGAKIREQKTRALLPTLEAAVKSIRSNMKSGQFTIFDLNSANDFLASAKLQALEAKSELSRIAALEHHASMRAADFEQNAMSLSGRKTNPAALQRSYAESQRQTFEYKDRKDFLDNFGIKLVGGYEQVTARNSSVSSGVTPYVSVELRMNLGASIKAFDGDQSEALQSWSDARKSVSTDASAPSVSISDRIQELNTKLAIHSARIKEINDYSGPMDSRMSAIQNSASALKLYGLRALANTELDATQAELAALKNNRSPASVTTATVSSPPTTPVKQTKTRFTRTDRKNFRFTQDARSAQSALLRFVIRQEMAAPKALGSGAIRHQAGLMLVQSNQCNLVYVMIRLNPKGATIDVQEKFNPGKSTHTECSNNGYRTIVGKSVPIGALKFGKEYALQAEILPSGIRVYLDKKLVWKGGRPQNIQHGDRIGMRSDNLIVDYELTENSLRSGVSP